MQRPTEDPVRRWSLAVRGVVQGVGFRPFVYQTAVGCGLRGWVRNQSDRVEIEVEGPLSALNAFVARLRDEAPPQSNIEALDVQEIPVLGSTNEPAAFEILGSREASEPRPTIPADLATCEQCLAELRNPAERRFGYPFINCTHCGPRWSIIQQLPYDRARTTMSGFVMCGDCRAEYKNPADRRFHAQPIACPRCGPTLQLLDADGRPLAVGSSALQAAIEAIREGRIVALKGLGGFQLLVDAASDEAVARLRRRKHRPDRPFALMFPALDVVRHYCDVSEQEAAELSSARAPIVLLKKKKNVATPSLSPLHSPLSTLLAPGNPYLGAMLPYTPLHWLLMDALRRPIVCTSGNLSDEPMAIDTSDALKRLGPIADVLLTHDRPIARPVDDSVVRVGTDGVQVLRRARGFAPRPIRLTLDAAHRPTVLAVGGHLKNAVALALSSAETASVDVVVGSHIGDLDGLASVEVFRRAIDDLTAFFHVVPEAVACDLHPDYASTLYARQLASRWNVPLTPVQHHHAHAASCMAEHGLTGPVLAFCWDGTGYGPDGTIWGGETLSCREATYHRVAHLRTFTLPGGDCAARQPRRSALGLLFELFGDPAAELAAEWFSPQELSALRTAIRRGLNAPRTSSMGRLFDAMAALCGLPPVISFEGQAAMALEFAAEPSEAAAYPMPLKQGDPSTPAIVDWGPMVRAALADRRAGLSVGRISAKFHNGLAEMVAQTAIRLGRGLPIALSGGCFQNTVLTEKVRARLSAEGFLVYTQHQVPPGDGGLSLGQAWLALQSSQNTSVHEHHVFGNPR